MPHKIELKLGRENLIIETGKLAKQANGAVCVRYGGTVVLVTAVCSNELREGIDFFPLTVEYQEKTYSAGRIPGGYFKRESRPTEKEILTSRLIDRPIRPLFPEGFRNDVQIIATVLSSDGTNDSDILAMIGASCALSISDIPFLGPIGAIKIGLVNGEFIVNPTFKETEESSLNVFVAGLEDRIIMIEAGANEVSDEKMLEAFEFSQKYLQELIDFQKKLTGICGKEKMKLEIKTFSDALYQKARGLSLSEFKKVFLLPTKEQREDAINVLGENVIEKLKKEDDTLSETDIKNALIKIEEEEVRRFILEEKKRVDGRRFDEVRNISCEVGFLPRTHGSAVFTRGQTQSLCTTTLGFIGRRKEKEFYAAL
jgi:polyribonucleotide nucleotidyltransferase